VRFTLKNVSDIPVEAVTSSFGPAHGPVLSSPSYKQHISWDNEEVINKQLPFLPDDSVDVVLRLDASSSNFVGPPIGKSPCRLLVFLYYVQNDDKVASGL
jgi:hypothetical protein